MFRTGISHLARAVQWARNEFRKLLFFASLLLVGALAFEAGVLAVSTREAKPLIITLPADPPGDAQPSQAETAPSPGRSAPPALPGTEPAVKTVGNCAFVGSRNSNLYHLPTCAPAKRIKPENLVCFASKEEAEQKGYQPGCLK